MRSTNIEKPRVKFGIYNKTGCSLRTPAQMLPCPKSYADVVANVALLFTIPFVFFALFFASIPAFFWVFFSYCGCCDCFAHIFWFITHYCIAYPINFCEKKVVHAISLLLHPLAFCWNFKNNSKIINFMREHSNSQSTKYQGL
jgi:hypothetical protein